MTESIRGGASPPVIGVTDEMFHSLHRRLDAGEVFVVAGASDGTNRILLRLESGDIVGADGDSQVHGSEVVSDTAIEVATGEIVAARQQARRL
jgi:hypothetical protein